MSMYSRYVKILKFLQILGHIGSFIVAGFCTVYYEIYYNSVLVWNEFFLKINYYSVHAFFWFLAILLCFANYIGTQTIIAVVDLLNRIEINTRNSKRN